MTIRDAVVDAYHVPCQRRIKELSEECAAWRLRVRDLEKLLAEAKSSAATANGIAAQVYQAIVAARGGAVAQSAEVVNVA